MPIRTRIEFRGTPFSDEIKVIEALPQLMLQAAEKTKKVIEPPWLQEAQYYPGAAKLPFDFATPKSKRYYFAVIAKRFPGRYVRSGKLKQSFFMRLLQHEKGIDFVLGTDSDIAKWVVDSFDRRRRYQVAGHRNTGWLPIADTAHFWLDAAEEDFMKQVRTLYAKFNAQRRNR